MGHIATWVLLYACVGGKERSAYHGASKCLLGSMLASRVLVRFVWNEFMHEIPFRRISNEFDYVSVGSVTSLHTRLLVNGDSAMIVE